MQGRVRFGLYDLDQTFPHQFEDRHEGHRDAATSLLGSKQMHEFDEFLGGQHRHDIGHALPDREWFSLYMVMRKHVAARQYVLEREQHLLQRHLRRDSDHLAFDEFGRSDPGIAIQARNLIEAFRGALEALVFLETTHELGARIGLLAGLIALRSRQQHPRLDLGESRGHQQVFARKFQLQHLHQLDVAHVLPRDLGDRNIEDVEVLAPDQIQQHVQRPFKGLQEHFERLWRNV